MCPPGPGSASQPTKLMRKRKKGVGGRQEDGGQPGKNWRGIGTNNYATKIRNCPDQEESIMLTGKSDTSKTRVGVATTYGQATF